MIPLLLVPVAWMPAAPRERAVRSVASASRTALAESARCAGTVYAGRCLPVARCGDGELDLDGVCLPTGAAMDEDRGATMETNAHVDRAGRRVVYEHLPRRPELPADYDRYVYPVAPYGGHTVTSGYDLDRRDEMQRRGETLRAVGHGGVDLPQERGSPVKVVSLRGEVGEPEVVFVGELFGNSVVLRHVVREGSTVQTYLALHGHLEAAAPDVAKGMTVRPGTTIGFVGDSGALGVVHLHYEVRLVRQGLDPMRVEPPQRLVDQEVSVPCDPRNVLPYR
jgi:murein DD-endopeptidase MepM/ murein hydrolase activator NlpD